MVRLNWTLVLAGTLSMAATGIAVSQEKEPSRKAPQAKAKAAEEDAKSKAAEEEAKEEASLAELEKMFVLPESESADDYMRFIDRIQKYRPDTDAQAQLFNRKAPLAMRKAAEKVVKLSKDKSSASFRRATGILVVAEANQLLQQLVTKTDGVPDDKLKGLITKVADFLALGEPGQDETQLAKELAGAFEQLNKPELAKLAYATFSKSIAASKDEAIAREGRRMAGIARRMDLQGKPVEIRGKTVDGKEFDIASLKGKVVLVDFWATWCGPCIAEHPNIAKNYEAYKDKGFEVVGISLDEGREELQEYLDKEKVPWITLHEEGAGGNSELAVHFGIEGIPTMMLLDKEGKLVSMNVRGPQLGKQLEKLLGAAEKPADKQENGEQQDESDK